jgi:hypothetical protein
MIGAIMIGVGRAGETCAFVGADAAGRVGAQAGDLGGLRLGLRRLRRTCSRGEQWQLGDRVGRGGLLEVESDPVHVDAIGTECRIRQTGQALCDGPRSVRKIHPDLAIRLSVLANSRTPQSRSPLLAFGLPS